MEKVDWRGNPFNERGVQAAKKLYYVGLANALREVIGTGAAEFASKQSDIFSDGHGRHADIPPLCSSTLPFTRRGDHRPVEP